MEKIREGFLHTRGIAQANAADFQAEHRETHRHPVIVVSVDFRAVQGGVLLIATLFIVVNLAADVLYAWLDPRIRYSK